MMLQVEKLLAEIQAMEGQSSGKASALKQGSLDARVRMFERLASEVARLNFYAVRGKVHTPRHTQNSSQKSALSELPGILHHGSSSPDKFLDSI